MIEFHGDIREPEMVRHAMQNCDHVIHLACISNDTSFDLDPGLGESINFKAFRPLVKAAKKAGVKRFIYASSSSVYGVKKERNVSEDLCLDPLTDYSKFKALCENILEEEREPGFTTLILRPATICGYAPRLRLDLTVNILTNLAVVNGLITVFGGTQLRPNIHINDMVDLYTKCLSYPEKSIDGQIFNIGYENYSVMEIAEIVRSAVGSTVEIKRSSTDDLRSYHISSNKISDKLGFIPSHSIEDAANDLISAFNSDLIKNSLTDPIFFNVRKMKKIGLK